ncbi:hypothetical protein AQEC111735_12040 [Aquirufa ecclesiirivi]
MVPVKAVPLICGLAKLKANLLKLASETVTDRRSAPAAEILPSVAATVADSALYKAMLAVATPFVNVKLVPVPKLVPATVGAVLGLNELAAPENVML